MTAEGSFTKTEVDSKEGKNKNVNRKAVAIGYLDVKYVDALLVDDKEMNGNADNPNIGAHIFSGSIL
jgi:hypothetical protein